MKLLKEDVNEEIEKYKKLLNQSLAVKYRDEELSYDKIKFIDKEIRGIRYMQCYVTIPLSFMKGDRNPQGTIRFHLGRTDKVSEQLQHVGLRDKLVNEIKKRINESLNIDENTIEEIEKYKKLLNQSLAKKYRDEQLSYDKIKFLDEEIRGIRYIQCYVTIPQITIKNDPFKSMGALRFHIGKSEDVIRQLEQPNLRDKLVNEIKKRINKRFDIE
jgi:hypothetical protein